MEMAAPVSTLCCYMTIVALNLFFVWKYSPQKPRYIRLFAKPILASALKDTSTVENLGEIADETYGNLSYLSVADWMPADLIHK